MNTSLGYKTAPGAGLAHPHIKSLVLSKFSPASKCMWDVGAGSGQISIEWQKLHPDCRVYAIERDGACIRAICENMAAHRTPRITVIQRDAAAGLTGLVAPDAINLGCVSWSDVNLCPVLWEYLAPGGTIVAVVGRPQGHVYIHEAQRTIGGEIGWAGDDACRFEYWAATKG